MYLLVNEIKNQPRVIELSEGQTSWLIGRVEDCDIVLKSMNVSRHHALLSEVGGEYYLEDANSTRGTFIDSVAVTERTQVFEGSRIQLADVTLVLTSLSGDEGYSWNSRRPGRLDSLLDDSRSLDFLYLEKNMQLKRKIHERILADLHLGERGALSMDLKKPENRRQLEKALNAAMREESHNIPGRFAELFKQSLWDELLELGPITTLLRDPLVDEIMVNGPNMVFKEIRGKIVDAGVRFYDERHLLSIIQRIVEKVGHHVDESSPMVDARLEDGSRVNAIIKPLSIDGAALTIRKFTRHRFTVEDLLRFGTLTREMAAFLALAVRCKQNMIIAGGTGSGKTTLLNVLSQFIPLDERLVTIEDSAELKLEHKNKVRLEARPANIEGKGKIAIRDLLVNSLRMRPDRIIIGECRAGEAWDMLQAMNTGHEGSLTTIHANTPRDALLRLENMVMMSGFELPVSAIREQAASAINLIIQENRLIDGSRRIVQISEVTGRRDNLITLQDIFTYEQEGVDADGMVVGHFAATGNIPQFVKTAVQRGVTGIDMGIFQAGGGQGNE